MFLTDHTGEIYHYSEEKNKMITAVTAFFFNTGIIYHIGYENGDVEAIPNTNGQSTYFGYEVFKLPEVRLDTISVDFSNVVITDEGYSGSVNVGGKPYPLPYRRHVPSPWDDWGIEPDTATPQPYHGAILMQDAHPGEIVYGGVETPDPETRVYEGSPFTRVRFVVNDDFSIRAVPEETNEEDLPY